MKRAIRRHQQEVAKKRKMVLMYGYAHGHSWRAFDRWYGLSGRIYETKPWHPVRHWLWTTPSKWTKHMMIRPARAKAKARCRMVEKGMEDGLLSWPDYKKPHIYYW